MNHTELLLAANVLDLAYSIRHTEFKLHLDANPQEIGDPNSFNVWCEGKNFDSYIKLAYQKITHTAEVISTMNT